MTRPDLSLSSSFSRRAFLASASAGAAALALPVDIAHAAIPEELNASERSRLMRGRLVTRRRSERRDGLRLFGGTSWRMVGREADTVWRAARDTGNLRHLLPECQESTVVSRRGAQRLVRFRHEYGVASGHYHATLTYLDAAKMLTFQHDPTHESDIRAGWGFLKVEPFHDNAIVCWGVLMDPGTALGTGAVRDLLHDWSLRIPSTVKRRLEGRAGARYVRG